MCTPANQGLTCQPQIHIVVLLTTKRKPKKSVKEIEKSRNVNKLNRKLNSSFTPVLSIKQNDLCLGNSQDKLMNKRQEGESMYEYILSIEKL